MTLTVVVAVAMATAVGWIVVSLFPGQLPADAHLPYAFNGVVGDVFDESVVPQSGPAPWVDAFLSVLETVTTLSVVVALFRSRRAANTLQPPAEAATRALLERFGAADSLRSFATRRDKSVVFGPDGRAAVTFRVEAGVCLASGDPVGAPPSWDGAITPGQVDPSAGTGDDAVRGGRAGRLRTARCLGSR